MKNEKIGKNYYPAAYFLIKTLYNIYIYIFKCGADDMKYIRELGAPCQAYKTTYNTSRYTEEELQDFCDEWNDEEPDGDTLYTVDED